MSTLSYAALESSWSFEAGPLVLAALALALFGQGFVRLRRRAAEHADWSRALLFTAGVGVALLAVVSPVDAIGEDQLLTAHMLQHLLLGDVAPLLLVLGVRGPLSLFLLPARALRVAARSPLRTFARLALRPRVAIALWLVSLGAWHVPAAYDAAIAHPALHAFEHACFATAGVLAWSQIVDPARRSRLSVGGRELFAFAMLAASGILSEVLVATQPLYPHYAGIADRPFGWTAAQDQSRAAVLMMAEQIATLATAMTFLVRAHVERVQPDLPR